jgi:hypothetical protein
LLPINRLYNHGLPLAGEFHFLNQTKGSFGCLLFLAAGLQR